jgi:hypothetical protein
VEEPTTRGLQLDRGRWWRRAGVGGRVGERVPTLDDGAATVAIDLSEWAWTLDRARVKSPNFHRLSQPMKVITVTSVGRSPTGGS